MSTLIMAPLRSKMITLPTREEWRAMLNRPSVAITAIVAGSLIVVAFLSAVVFLAYNDKGTEVLTGAGMIGLVTALATLYQKLKTVERHVTSNDGGSGNG